MVTTLNDSKAGAKFTILVYILDQEWFMDDPIKGIVMEPLVRGVPEIIKALVGRKVDRFSVIFTSDNQTAHSHVLVRKQPEDGGYWYQLQGTTMKGWLCPVLMQYFEQAPENMYLSWRK
jgi:hypothetical protein